MNHPKFISKEDWCIETEFLGKKNKKVIYEKGHIFEPTVDGNYVIIDPYGAERLVDEKTMRGITLSFDNDKPFFDVVVEEDNLELIIEEIPDNDDILVRNWRIQLDVKTTRKKLKEVEKVINEYVKPILNA